MRYRVYGAIVEAVREGRLHDGPFDRNDFAAACPETSARERTAPPSRSTLTAIRGESGVVRPRSSWSIPMHPDFSLQSLSAVPLSVAKGALARALLE
jgi:hypothetical protein